MQSFLSCFVFWCVCLPVKLGQHFLHICKISHLGDQSMLIHNRSSWFIFISIKCSTVYNTIYFPLFCWWTFIPLPNFLYYINTALNNPAHVSLYICARISPRCVPTSRAAGSQGIYSFNYTRICLSFQLVIISLRVWLLDCEVFKCLEYSSRHPINIWCIKYYIK